MGTILARVPDELEAELDAYLEDEYLGLSHHVNFERLAGTGFAPEWTLRELAERFEAAAANGQFH